MPLEDALDERQPQADASRLRGHQRLEDARRRMVSLTPGPESSKASSTASGSTVAVSAHRQPESSTAWTAFSSRLTKTCRSWLGIALHRGSMSSPRALTITRGGR